MRGVKLLVLLSCAATLAACGLPDPYFLQPPVKLAPTPGSYFEFLNPDHALDSPDIAFKGFELYYRFFPDLGSIIDNAIDINDLSNKGFLPVVRDTDSPPGWTVPVIPIDPADKFTAFSVHVNINTVVVTESNFTFIPPITSLPGNVRRDVKDTILDPTRYKTYYYNDITNPNNYKFPDDTDCSLIYGLIADPPGKFAFLAMFAMSYGLQGISSPRRSDPVYLGYLELRIN